MPKKSWAMRDILLPMVFKNVAHEKIKFCPCFFVGMPIIFQKDGQRFWGL